MYYHCIVANIDLQYNSVCVCISFILKGRKRLNVTAEHIRI